jgi:hypothetical protein
MLLFSIVIDKINMLNLFRLDLLLIEHFKDFMDLIVYVKPNK